MASTSNVMIVRHVRPTKLVKSGKENLSEKEIGYFRSNSVRADARLWAIGMQSRMHNRLLYAQRQLCLQKQLIKELTKR